MYILLSHLQQPCSTIMDALGERTVSNTITKAGIMTIFNIRTPCVVLGNDEGKLDMIKEKGELYANLSGGMNDNDDSAEVDDTADKMKDDFVPPPTVLYMPVISNYLYKTSCTFTYSPSSTLPHFTHSTSFTSTEIDDVEKADLVAKEVYEKKDLMAKEVYEKEDLVAKEVYDNVKVPSIPIITDIPQSIQDTKPIFSVEFSRHHITRGRFGSTILMEESQWSQFFSMLVSFIIT